jgi:hypothetical protein
MAYQTLCNSSLFGKWPPEREKREVKPMIKLEPNQNVVKLRGILAASNGDFLRAVKETVRQFGWSRGRAIREVARQCAETGNKAYNEYCRRPTHQTL